MKENIFTVLIILAMVFVCTLLFITFSDTDFNLPNNSAASTDTTKDKTNSSEFKNTKYNYEKIYDEYSARLKKECPTLSITECAEISNEGVTKMAEYMYSALGTDGQYATYEQWANKLMDVYLEEAK